eukprot:9560837-Lingulodinium_polyedra.AAC.1
MRTAGRAPGSSRRSSNGTLVPPRTRRCSCTFAPREAAWVRAMPESLAGPAKGGRLTATRSQPAPRR